MTGIPTDLALGGVCAWTLPTDASGPAAARSLLVQAMTALALPSDTIDDGRSAVCEAATNAFTHARPEPGAAKLPAPELWIYARTWPQPALVVSIFDGLPSATPHPTAEDPLAESGRGVTIIDALATDWGCRRSRSRLASPVANGKAVWFALPLPPEWPARHPYIPPATAAKALQRNLAARGIESVRHDDARVSMLELPTLNIWIDPKHYAWQLHPGTQARHPLLDLQEATDRLLDDL